MSQGSVVKSERPYEAKMRAEGCRFCQKEWHEKAIAEHEGWIAVPNEFPRVDALFVQPVHQIVLVPVDHLTESIDASGFVAIAHLRDQLVERLGLRGYGICIREGERLWSGKTVPHIHAHLIVPQVVTLADGTLHASTFNFPIGDREAPK